MDFSNPRIIGQSNHDGQDNSGYYNSDLQSDEVQTYLSDNPGVQHFDDWTPPKIPNHISPQPEVQPEATFGPKETDSNNSSRTEPTFHLQDTSALSTQDLTSAIELDPSLLLYGTNFDKLLAQDPVHVHIMRLVEKHAKDPRIPVYAKVGFLKLATINKAKVGNLQDVELDSMMAAVRLAQHNNEERRNAENEYEKVIRDCIDQYHWLHDKNNRLQDKVAGTFRNILKSTGYDIPKAINPKAVDDLSCILVASTSDWYYKTAPGITLNVDMTDQATPDDTLDTDMTDQAASTEDLATPSSLEYNFKPPEAPSVPIKRICVNVITHLSLLGGRPANVSRFYTHDYASFDGFMNRLSKARGQSRAQYPERLGFLTDQQMELGKWLYQMATGMETLDLERNAWRLVDEKSYDTLSCAENEQIFLIHVSLIFSNGSSPLHSQALRCLSKCTIQSQEAVVSTEGPRNVSNS